MPALLVAADVVNIARDGVHNLNRRGFLARAAGALGAAIMLSVAPKPVEAVAPDMDALCGRRHCGHEYGRHYLAFDGSAGCPMDHGYCECDGFQIEPDEIEYPAYGRNVDVNFIPTIWSQEFLRMIEEPTVLMNVVNREYDPPVWSADGGITISKHSYVGLKLEV